MVNMRADIQLFVHSNTDMNIHVIPVGPECQLPWNVFVYNVCLERKKLFLCLGRGVGWGGEAVSRQQNREERRRRRRVVSLQPERLAEGWRLRGAAKREDLDWRGAEREECVCVDVLARLTNGVCVTDKKGTRGYYAAPLDAFGSSHTHKGRLLLPFSHLNLIKRFFSLFWGVTSGLITSKTGCVSEEDGGWGGGFTSTLWFCLCWRGDIDGSGLVCIMESPSSL